MAKLSRQLVQLFGLVLATLSVLGALPTSAHSGDVKTLLSCVQKTQYGNDWLTLELNDEGYRVTGSAQWWRDPAPRTFTYSKCEIDPSDARIFTCTKQITEKNISIAQSVLTTQQFFHQKHAGLSFYFGNVAPQKFAQNNSYLYSSGPAKIAFRAEECH